MRSIFSRALAMLQHKSRPIWHSGGALNCPVCDHAVRAFEPVHPHFIQNWLRHGFDLPLDRMETLNISAYSCPLCTVSDRDRLYALYLKKMAPTLALRGRFIEFAPIGALTACIRRLLPNWEVRTADLFMPNVDDRVDLCDMRGVYQDETVDLFLCSHVLEHVADDRAALRELYRILKPGGRGIIMVPIHLDLIESREGPRDLTESQRWKCFGQNDHLRLHSRNDFIGRIRDAGFRVDEFGKEQFGSMLLLRHGCSTGSVLYVGHKA
jgi:SAM-dependent methyltransferase